MRHATVFAFAFSLLLAACQTAAYRGDQNSPYYLVPAGSRLVLNRAITVPANDVGVYIQNGEVAKSFWRVKQHYPYCALDLRRRQDAPRAIEPDEFTIVRVRQESVMTVRLPLVHVADAVQDGGASYEIYATVMTLRSERQPGVDRLTCAQWEYPPLQRHVTINEMRKTLGDLFTLRLPGKGDKSN